MCPCVSWCRMRFSPSLLALAPAPGLPGGCCDVVEPGLSVALDRTATTLVDVAGIEAHIPPSGTIERLLRHHV